MKKNLLLIGLIFLGATITKGDNYEKAEKLKLEKQKIAILMHNKRVELIKTVPTLKALQKKIIALHRELAIRIDNNSEMRKLIAKDKAITTELNIIHNE